MKLPDDFSRATTTIESIPPSPTIERHPLFVKGDKADDPTRRFRYGRAQGDVCASCSFTVPQDVTAQLPAGAPGSMNPDGKGKNGSPVLRSREFVCLGGGDHNAAEGDDKMRPTRTSSDESNPSSSFNSVATANSTCHDHLMTYLTSRSPDDPTNFSLLRASVIRTLSCELLPRGMSDGPFCFGDPVTGYTIAYVFRLTDPKARGRRRAYAFVALAGKDATRAFRACPMVWEAFATMAQGIEDAAQRSQDVQKRKEEEEREISKSRNYTPVSSFLTHRTTDPDGFPRRAGQVSPRSIAEIVGDENIFALLHQYFVTVLRCLGERFGGIPLSDKPTVYQTVADEKGIDSQQAPLHLRTELVEDIAKLRDADATPKPNGTNAVEAAMSNLKIATVSVNMAAQCAPLPSEHQSQRQVVV